MKNYSKIWISFLIGLGGCADNDFSDLDAFFEASYSLPGLTIEPVPQTMPYQAFAYRAARVRSPFSLPPDPNGISKESPVLSEPPDMKRQREFLETFSLESLTMVGSLNRAGKIWCLIRDSEGGVHRVSTGSFLGLNHGKVVSATEDSIKVVEIVTDGTDGGWIERPRSLILNSF